MSAYFDILELPKSAVEIKADLLLYKDWISLVVNVWGGPEFHLDAMDSLVDKDPDAEIIYVDDEYYTTLAGYGTELVYGIAISHKRRSIFVVFRGSAVWDYGFLPKLLFNADLVCTDAYEYYFARIKPFIFTSIACLV